MHEPAEARVRALRVVDELRSARAPSLSSSLNHARAGAHRAHSLDRLGGRDGEDGLHHARAEPGEEAAGGRDFALTHGRTSAFSSFAYYRIGTHLSVRERVLEVVVGHKPHTCLDGIACVSKVG